MFFKQAKMKINLNFLREFERKDFFAVNYAAYFLELDKYFFIDHQGIKSFSYEKGLIETIGKKGKNNDEYLSPYKIGYKNKKLYIWDIGNKKLSIYDTTANYPFLKKYNLPGFDDIGASFIFGKYADEDAIFFPALKMINNQSGYFMHYLNLKTGNIYFLPDTLITFDKNTTGNEHYFLNLIPHNDEEFFITSIWTSKIYIYSLKNMKIIKTIDKIPNMKEISDPEIKKMASKVSNSNLLSEDFALFQSREDGKLFGFDLVKRKFRDVELYFDRKEDKEEYLSVAIEKKEKGMMPVADYRFFTNITAGKLITIINMEKIKVFDYILNDE